MSGEDELGARRIRTPPTQCEVVAYTVYIPLGKVRDAVFEVVAEAFLVADDARAFEKKHECFE
jgi:hypothetical protein